MGKWHPDHPSKAARVLMFVVRRQLCLVILFCALPASASASIASFYQFDIDLNQFESASTPADHQAPILDVDISSCGLDASTTRPAPSFPAIIVRVNEYQFNQPQIGTMLARADLWHPLMNFFYFRPPKYVDASLL